MKSAWVIIVVLPLGLIFVELSSRLAAINTVGTFSRVEYEVCLTLVDNHRHMRAAKPTVGYDAIRAYRIRSCKFQRTDIRARHSPEELSRETALSVECESGHGSKVFSRRVQTVATVQRRVGTGWLTVGGRAKQR